MLRVKNRTSSPQEKKIRGFICCLGCTAALGLGFSFCLPWGPASQVWAAESSVIESLSVTVDPVWGEPEEIREPQIKVSGKGISLTGVEYRTDLEAWRPGKEVRIELDITADEGKHVPNSLKESECKVKGAEFVSARAQDDRTLRVRVDYVPVCVLGETEEAGWSDLNPGKAVWKRVRYAPGYSLTLYGNDKSVKKMTVTDNSVDLGSYMRKNPDKYYYYEVKAVPVTNLQKKYLKEGETIISKERLLDEDALTAAPEFSYGEMDNGSIKGDHYIYPNGSKAANTWKLVDGKWYYFGPDGRRTRGWLNYGGRWYYMSGDGIMRTGWIQMENGSWYYLNPDGAMATYWIQLSPNEWYYLSGDGRMRTGWRSFGDGSWYYFNSNGTMAAGWIQPSPGQWYYMNRDGRMQTGWLSPGDGFWYYLNPNGVMHTGWLWYNDAWYYLYGNGSMAVNTIIDGWQIGPDGRAGKES